LVIGDWISTFSFQLSVWSLFRKRIGRKKSKAAIVKCMDATPLSFSLWELRPLDVNQLSINVEKIRLAV
jgi:hypothetical protein